MTELDKLVEKLEKKMKIQLKSPYTLLGVYDSDWEDFKKELRELFKKNNTGFEIRKAEDGNYYWEKEE